ncbi:MAG: zinc-ribbon domain-containing protein [Pyrinomonadaceae bacterium]
MAEILVENQVCQSCGADVRPDSLFCYNCGSSVAPETVVALKDKNIFDKSHLGEQSVEGKNGDNAALAEKTAAEEISEQATPIQNAQATTELKSAASMRRKSKVFQPKRIEVIWEEYENAPNGWFILAAIGLTLFAVGLFFLAQYLK